MYAPVDKRNILLRLCHLFTKLQEADQKIQQLSAQKVEQVQIRDAVTYTMAATAQTLMRDELSFLQHLITPDDLPEGLWGQLTAVGQQPLDDVQHTAREAAENKSE